MEYGSTHTSFRLINSPSLNDCLDSLSQWRNAASSSLFYRNFHADYSYELANCMSPPLPRHCCTRLSTFSHPYSVHLPNARVNQNLHSFIPDTGKLWNSLPLSVFPPAYDVNSFTSRHIMTPLILSWTSTPWLYFSYCTLLQDLATSGNFFFQPDFVCPWPVPFQCIK